MVSHRHPHDVAAWRARLEAEGAPAVGRDAIERACASIESHRAFIEVDPAGAPQTSGVGALSGVPFAVKDNIFTRELPTTAGSHLLAGWRADRDAAPVAALRRAGGWMVGKTNMHELALGVTSANGAFGAVRNAADPDRSPGGSSGGSAVAVALGVVPVALGTDTGGSMTIPAAACGVVGYRPSSGRYPSADVVHISATRDEVGIMATTVEDVAMVDAIIRGAAPDDGDGPGGPAGRPVALGVPREYLERLVEATRVASERAFEALRAAGVVLRPVELGSILHGAREHGFPVVGFEAPRDLGRFLDGPAGHLGLDVRDLAQGAGSRDVGELLGRMLDDPVPVGRHRAAIGERSVLRARFARLLDENALDALVYPTLPVLPPLLEEDVVSGPDGELPVFPTLTRHTEAGAFLGTPSITIPCAGTGPAVGLTVEGRHADDAAVLRITSQLAGLLAAVSAADSRPSRSSA